MTNSCVMSHAPTWDLSSLYDSMNDHRIRLDMSRASALVEEFGGLRARVANLTPDQLLRAIRSFESILVIITKVTAFANLSKVTDQLHIEKSAFAQKITEEAIDLNKRLQFFELEINDIKDLNTNDGGVLAPYEHWLYEIRKFKPHQLSLESENLLSDMNIVGFLAWVRLYDEVHAALKYSFRGEQLSYAQISDKLMAADEHARKSAADAITSTLRANSHLLTFITNNLAKNKDINDRLRGFARPISHRNLENNVSDEVVDTLVHVVKANYNNIAHRYYKYKARVLGKSKLDYWDRNAPLLDIEPKRYSWDEAKSIVLESFRDFSSNMCEMAEMFFSKNKIDAVLAPNKYSGAFCYSLFPGEIPYILLNFSGSVEDVYTLAHELGHGVHYFLASKQSYLQYRAPLTFAETASVFSEQLLSRKLLAIESDRNQRALLIARIVEGFLNTVFRQIAFCEFERILHDTRKGGELSSKAIGEIWMQIQAEVLGDGVNLAPEYTCWWSMVPHFIHSPFYVYAYAFGACLVNALYSAALKDKTSFVHKYEQMLSMGGTVSVDAMKSQFGFDLTTREFWQNGLDMVVELIDELEQLL